GLDGPLVVMNGDTFFSGALDDLVAFHRRRPAAGATIALARVDDAGRYGTVAFDPATGAVTAFVEKGGQQGGAWINAGVYVLEPALREALPPGRSSLERDAFAALAGRGLYGCPFPDAAFLDIGTPEDYARAAEVLTSI